MMTTYFDDIVENCFSGQHYNIYEKYYEKSHSMIDLTHKPIKRKIFKNVNKIGGSNKFTSV